MTETKNRNLIKGPKVWSGYPLLYVKIYVPYMIDENSAGGIANAPFKQKILKEKRGVIFDEIIIQS